MDTKICSKCIEHKKCLSSSALTDEKQIAEVCHYTNLQPLGAIDNLKKGAKNE